ncbi:argininosuccinate lyase [Fulvivirga sedimenti]|uniref:Argininosuccinate lyase n=1 Tax=Fulvivirga sedimenti TaxID=2879465 RepID=A0A9X1HR27_9BACT|nr:argininosuccinate lyase [Fulvivirga sedimenti]MCA6075248.1 argininosuccinate lyase [Fulvivirga sedimenti]MCA6076425.1 argininosuccinate lyase [Fulvivirga sedimenti]MCA6077553.1 argininosuccinate lyase [Fulvivirga sedimenti]
MKLWDKGYSIEKKIEQFTVGDDRIYDLKLATYDVEGSRAHARMLAKQGLISNDEIAEIEQALDQIQGLIQSGDFLIEDDFEDVHSKIEYLLTELLGDAGKRIHTARSRNDQVLVDLHLFFKDELRDITELVKNLFDRLMLLADQHKEIIIPGYTHMQVAMPSSFGLWFSSYAETLIDDIYFLRAAQHIADQNPLGSAAGYGSSFPIDRSMTTRELGFSTMKYNVVAAQMGRGKLERSVAMAMASVASTIARMAMDVCLYNSQNFGFLSFPDELTTGSSIMPHKKNPDVWELIRGRCNRIQAAPTEITMLTNNLPSGYHREYQLLKESIFPSIDSLKACLDMAEYMLQHVIINKNAANDERYRYMYTVENVNEEVMKGATFRDAYKTVGKQVGDGTYKPISNLSHTHEGSIGNLCLKEIREKMNSALSS